MRRSAETNEGLIEKPDYNSGLVYQSSNFRGPLAGLADLAEMLKRRSEGSRGHPDAGFDENDPSIRATRIGSTTWIEFVPVTPKIPQ